MAASSDELLARRRQLNDRRPPPSSKCLLYVMSRDQRTVDNHALLAAQHHAIAGRLPLIVAFVVYPGSGERAREHFAFMLDGLADVADSLAAHDITFVIRTDGRPLALLRELIDEVSPAAVYVDFSPLRGPRALRR
ncbi:MAG TPA: deoxyribodipyrimidine photo-lyase, partial [Micromonosporaceae bacterium]